MNMIKILFKCSDRLAGKAYPWLGEDKKYFKVMKKVSLMEGM